jgi:hypothetical protein
MNGSYLASQVRRLSGPIIAFREYAIRDVIPAFGNLDARAEQVANDYYNRIGSQPAGEYEIDMADVAEDAQQHSYDWWEMMASLRQTMLNLMAAGLFHLVEQQLATLSRDGIFDGPVGDTKLSIVAEWYQRKLGTTLAEMPSWSTINEMRLVANTVKHGEGNSARDLREVNPALFNNPAYIEFLRSEGVDRGELLTRDSLAAPLSGEDFFVTEEVLHGYAVRADAFFAEIAADLFPRE